jgi:hypothetical protein
MRREGAQNGAQVAQVKIVRLERGLDHAPSARRVVGGEATAYVGVADLARYSRDPNLRRRAPYMGRQLKRGGVGRRSLEEISEVGQIRSGSVHLHVELPEIERLASGAGDRGAQLSIPQHRVEGIGLGRVASPQRSAFGLHGIGFAVDGSASCEVKGMGITTVGAVIEASLQRDVALRVVEGDGAVRDFESAQPSPTCRGAAQSQAIVVATRPQANQMSDRPGQGDVKRPWFACERSHQMDAQHSERRRQDGEVGNLGRASDRKVVNDEARGGGQE